MKAIGDASVGVSWKLRDSGQWLVRDLRTVKKGAPTRGLPTIDVTSVGAVLERFGDDFSERMPSIYEGHEEYVLGRSETVLELIRAFEVDRHAQRAVEATLDRWFARLQPGVEFEYTEQVLALLLAMKRAEVSWFGDVAAVFTSSAAAEIGRVRRFVRRLQRQ